MEADHVALKRHPVAHRALIFGFTGLGVLGSDQGAAAVVAVDLPHTLGGGVFARFARDKVGLPNDISALVIVARVLFGQVDVDIRLPVGLSLCGKGVGLLGVLDLDFAGLLVVNGVLDLLGERAAVDGPTKVAAFDGALLAIGARPPASGATVLKPLASSAAQLLICDVSSVGLAGSAKLIHCNTELPSTCRILAVELEGHVDAQEVVGGIACGLNLIIGQRSIERLIGIVAELGKIYGLGQRGKLELGILNDMLAVDFLVGARLLDGKLAGLLVIGAIGLERARTALVKLVDSGAQVLLKLLLVKGVGEHGQVDVLIKIDFVGGSGCFWSCRLRIPQGGPAK